MTLSHRLLSRNRWCTIKAPVGFHVPHHSPRRHDLFIVWSVQSSPPCPVQGIQRECPWMSSHWNHIKVGGYFCSWLGGEPSPYHSCFPAHITVYTELSPFNLRMLIKLSHQCRMTMNLCPPSRWMHCLPRFQSWTPHTLLVGDLGCHASSIVWQLSTQNNGNLILQVMCMIFRQRA